MPSMEAVASAVGSNDVGSCCIPIEILDAADN